MSWATAADVLTLIGKTVSAADVLMASEQITIYANRTEEASATFGERDREWLRKATVWQAAFLAENPGVESRQIVATHQQGGVRVDHAGASFVPREYPVVLAPMAARALRNLSWKGSRTLRIPNVATPLGSNIDFTLETSDDRSEWHPLT
jgi:hypothetical protein